MPAIPDSARDAIGRRLRQSLDQIVAEPVPDRFLRLLEALEAGAVEVVAPVPSAEGGRSEDVDG